MEQLTCGSKKQIRLSKIGIKNMKELLLLLFQCPNYNMWHQPLLIRKLFFGIQFSIKQVTKKKKDIKESMKTINKVLFL